MKKLRTAGETLPFLFIQDFCLPETVSVCRFCLPFLFAVSVCRFCLPFLFAVSVAGLFAGKYFIYSSCSRMFLIAGLYFCVSTEAVIAERFPSSPCRFDESLSPQFSSPCNRVRNTPLLISRCRLKLVDSAAPR